MAMLGGKPAVSKATQVMGAAAGVPFAFAIPALLLRPNRPARQGVAQAPVLCRADGSLRLVGAHLAAR